jgi:hypothetical protein
MEYHVFNCHWGGPGTLMWFISVLHYTHTLMHNINQSESTDLSHCLETGTHFNYEHSVNLLKKSQRYLNIMIWGSVKLVAGFLPWFPNKRQAVTLRPSDNLLSSEEAAEPHCTRYLHTLNPLLRLNAVRCLVGQTKRY